MSLSNILKRYLHQFVNIWSLFKRDPYFISIIDSSYNDSEGGLVIKFHVANKRITKTMLVSEFINSPLIYAVHPKQLYLIGYDSGQLIMSLEVEKNKTRPRQSKNRFKRVFHDE